MSSSDSCSEDEMSPLITPTSCVRPAEAQAPENESWIGILPPGTKGMALGWCGVGSILLEIAPSNSPQSRSLPFVSVAVPTVTALAGALLLAFSVRCALAGRARVAIELASVEVVPAYAAGVMASLFVVSRGFGHWAAELAQILAYFLSCAQFILCVHFLMLCRARGRLPEPFWNPPTVGSAVTTVVGLTLKLPAWFTISNFILAVTMQTLLVKISVHTSFFLESEVECYHAHQFLGLLCCLNQYSSKNNNKKTNQENSHV